LPNHYAFDYDASDLKTAIYGTTAGGTLTAVQVDDTGRTVITGNTLDIISGHVTSTSTQASLDVDSTAYSLWPADGVDVSEDTMVTFAVFPVNSDVKYKIQISPDNSTTVYWKDDTNTTIVASGNLSTLVTKTYLKYAALAYTANYDSATANVWYQTQK
jgi:hypothetical protein